MRKKPDTKPELIAAYSLQAVLILTIALAVITQEWLWVIGGFISVFIGFLPQILHKDVRFTLPWQIELFIALVAGLNVGGMLLKAYVNIPYYGLITEFLILVLVALICFALVYIFDEYWDGLMMDKYAMAFLVAVTTMASTVVLEFIKWFLFPYLEPTAEDILISLFAGMIAGIATALIGVSLIKKGKFEVFTEEMGKQINEMVIKKIK